LFTDGGVFDNLGMERVSNAGTILISDGGRGAGPLPSAIASVPEGSLAQSSSQHLPASNQLEALKWILGSLDDGPAKLRLNKFSRRLAAREIEGAYWSIGSGIDTGETGLTEGYPQELASTLIATIRTQLDAFSDAERHILENHGYLMAEAAIRVQAPGLIRRKIKLSTPWPNALPLDFVKRNLRNSSNLSSGLRTIKNLFGV
jgi:NTE family protein